MSLIEIDDYDEYEQRNGGRRPRRTKPNHKPKRHKWEVARSLYEADANGRNETVFAPSVNASSEEMAWITEHLAQFFHGKLITDVARRVKSGKEANVYCCPGHPDTGRDLIAAKLYRPRKYRSLKNTTLYEQGRSVLNADGSAVGPRDWRLLKAIAGKSRKGVSAAQTSWLTYEYLLINTLYAAGADVPEPIKHNEYALLMEYIGDATMPAPALIDVKLDSNEARMLFERVVHNIEIMLACGWVHGDLSAYNVLYWEGQIKIIDFPQVVDPRTNPDARAIFRRDVERVCQYFARYGVQSDPRRLAQDFWANYTVRKEPAG